MCARSRPTRACARIPSSQEREEIKALRKEVYELRRANEILKAASVFFATELDADRPR
jgi:transposase